MSADEGFLDAILASPEDNAPRLVYADWLEENGRPERAALIRVQIELATTPDYLPRWSVLKTRERALLEAYQAEWLRPLEHIRDDAGKDDSKRWTFKRGFVAHAVLAAPTFVRHAEELARLVPLRSLRLAGTGSQLRAALFSPWLARIPELMLEDKLSPDDFRLLAEAPALAGLRGLYLGSTGLTAASAAVLAASPHLSDLRTLNLCFTPVGDDGMAALAFSPYLANLESLRLTGAAVGGYGAAAIVRSPHLRRLRDLALGGRWSTARVGRALASSSDPPPLTHLDLELGAIGSAGVAALAGSTLLAGVTDLNLTDNGLGPKGAAALAASPHLKRLRELDLSGNRIGTRGALALAAADNLRGLVHLDLGYCRIGPEGVRALAESPHVAGLENLSLGENTVGAEGAAALAGSPHLARLKRLDLTHTPSLRQRDVRRLRDRFGDALLV